MKNCLFICFVTIFFLSCGHEDHHPLHEHDGDHDHSSAEKEYYEHRVYELSSSEQQASLQEFIAEALIPAYHRQGIEHVGAFAPIESDENGFNIHLIVPLDDLEDFGDLYDNIYADQSFLTAGGSHLNLNVPEEKAFDRVNSRLLIAFDSMPMLEVPAADAADRIFELRSYESFSELKGRKKVAMFDEGGEVTIFKSLGFQPVFFAEALTGDEVPNLLYMITFDSPDLKDGLWKSFSKDPRWQAIKDLPEYANTVSKIHSYMLKAIPGSDIR